MLYALLKYFVVFLGSMVTCEDIFYKCYTPSEDLSTHVNISGQKLLDRIIVREYFFFFYIFNIIHSVDYRLVLYTCSNITIVGEDKQILISGTGDCFVDINNK